MPHHVYANNNEIATKSSDGKSAACFPDVCFSPPTPPATGVPIPYANTCFAKDITNGSKTVIIGGAEVALENYSYFKSSVGDAPATHALKKGIRSGNVDGRGFFQTWSQNVKVEGKGVCRHMDLVTHNHTNAGNTVHHPFISTTTTKSDCKKDLNKADKKCTPDKRDKDKFLKKIYGKNYNKLKAKLNQDKASKSSTTDNEWIGNFCSGLMLKPVSLKGVTSLSSTQKQIKKMQDDLKTINDDLKSVMQGVMQEGVVGIATNVGAKKVGNAALRHGVALAGGPAAPVTETVATVVTIADGLYGIYQIGSQYSDLKNMKNIATRTLSQLKKVEESLLGLSSRRPEKNYAVYQRAQAELMTALADLNPCIHARRCILVEFSDTETHNVLRGKGCCPGQTGHHVMPDSMFANAVCTSSYKYSSAPVICLEGTNNTHGSHGEAHETLKTLLKGKEGKGIEYADARDASVKAILEVAPHCDKKCLISQLDSYYKNCTKLVANSGNGGATNTKGNSKIK